MTTYQLACEDAGHAECPFMMRSANADDIVESVRAHAQDVHEEEHSPNEIKDLVQEVDWEPR